MKNSEQTVRSEPHFFTAKRLFSQVLLNGHNLQQVTFCYPYILHPCQKNHFNRVVGYQTRAVPNSGQTQSHTRESTVAYSGGGCI